MIKKQIARKPKQNLVKEINAAIALLNRVRTLAAATAVPDGKTVKSAKPALVSKQTKRALSADAREAIAAAQKKRWAKVRRQKKQAERAAAAQEPAATVNQ